MNAASALLLAVKSSILLTVFSLGLNATWQDALSVFRDPWLLMRSVLSMNVIMPLVAAGLVVTFDLPATVKIALVALAISPVPPILPKKELKAGGHASYAVGLLVAIAILAIVTVPVTMTWFAKAFDRTVDIAPFAVTKIVLASVLAPLAAGIVLRQWAPAFAERIARPVGLLGTLLLIASALPLAYASWPAIRQLFGNGTVLIVATMAAIGLCVGHLLGGPRAENRTVLALSTTSRHPAIALTAAVAAGAETKPELAAILLYVIVALLVSIPYVAWRKRQAIAAQASVVPTRTISR
jgi:bile acid:Na+ symporter, BASS family